MRIIAAAIVVVGLAVPAGAQSPDERAAAREAVGRNGDAIVTVMATLKARMSREGRDNPAPDQAVRASATVIDASGLTVMALSAIDPGNIISKTPAVTQGNMTFTTELSDVKMRLADGREVPAQVVLRDSDLDLLFVKPTTAPAAPMAAVLSSASVMALMDPVIVVQRLGELTGWKPSAAFGAVEVVVEKPRIFYIIATQISGSATGATVFDMKGQFAGIVTLRAGGDSKTNALNGLQGSALQMLGLTQIVVPVADIREVARQVK